MIFAVSLFACTNCSYGGILDVGLQTCSCNTTGGRSAASCCAKCTNPAKDAQSDCATCLDQYADFSQNCYACQPGAEFFTMQNGQKSCRPISVVYEGRLISYIIGGIYVAAAIVIATIMIRNKYKSYKNLK